MDVSISTDPFQPDVGDFTKPRQVKASAKPSAKPRASKPAAKKAPRQVKASAKPSAKSS